ncbi:MAG: nucleotidyl transferase AbiEii/AbiGii toxin family protein [Pelagibacterales bacterium]|nr:nucleotidyl transferase AbiEii/AbiGii toxin family protein [Pelagibacterales bacterium]
MIPAELIEQWREKAPWKEIHMVEQDLIINRALVCLYNNQKVQNSLIFRGGTALNKIYLKPAARYSEDLDFVQKSAESIGETLDEIRIALDWLGKPSSERTSRSVKLVYKYTSVSNLRMKLKIEINILEHFQIKEISKTPFEFESEWFSGNSVISVNQIEELMATKIRALYQRRKGRDLFDLWYVFSKNLADVDETIRIFKKYCEWEGISVSQTMFQNNLDLKKLNRDFRVDMEVLLPYKIEWNFDEAFEFVLEKIIGRM